MRFLHISDLHFGKSFHGISLLESGDQPYWVERFLELTDEVRPQAVVIRRPTLSSRTSRIRRMPAARAAITDCLVDFIDYLRCQFTITL